MVRTKGVGGQFLVGGQRVARAAVEMRWVVLIGRAMEAERRGVKLCIVRDVASGRRVVMVRMAERRPVHMLGKEVLR